VPENERLPGSAVPGSPDADREATPEITDALGQVQQLPNISAFDLTSAEDGRRKELLQAAVGYAGHGWLVVPVWWLDPNGHCHCPRGEECPSPAKHPVFNDWPHVATYDRELVASWWRPQPEGLAQNWFPRANIGIVTGRSSGIFVLDEDTYAGGEQTLGAYERRHGPMPATRVHQTSRGGKHYFFTHPDFDIRNSVVKVLGAGLDIRGENGFVVAPPSMGAHGLYELNPAHDIEPAEAPAWLLDILRKYDREQLGATISGAEPTEATGAARKYAEAALAAEAEAMRNAEPGTRNDTLNRCAFSLGTLGGAGLLTEDASWSALHRAALDAGLSEGEIRGTFLSGWRKGLEEPRHVQWQVMAADWVIRPRTEFGLADRMADHFGDSLRWCPEQDTWLTYRNGVWISASKRAGEWAAQSMLRRLEFTEAEAYDDDKVVAPDGTTEVDSPREQFLGWVAKQQTRKAVSAAAHLATGLQLMQMSQATFDADPLLLNVSNGVVNLSTGELVPHDPEQRMTLQCVASFYPGEPAPKFERFLQRVQPDPDMRAYLQRVAGYAATGLTNEQVFFLLTGKGANGKSVWQEVVAHVLGTYSQTMPVETLTASSVDGRIPNDVARMAGKRYLVASETKAGKSLDEQRLKQLTGGDSVTARYMRGEWFEFRPVGKLQLSTNHLPRMSDDAATWRRIHLIPWPVTIPPEERDGYLKDTLIREEANGILAWIVEGALAWHAMGLAPPAAMREALTQYQEDEDVVGQFVSECLDEVPPLPGAAGRDVASIYQTYAGWARREGHPVPGQRWLTGRLKKKYEYRRVNSWAGFPGLQPRLPIGLEAP
jgi:putative DNA primase/helicase